MKNQRRLLRIFAVSITAALAAASVVTWVGCKSGGEVTTRPVVSAAAAVKIIVPTIATPPSTPYYSSSSSLVITGMCADSYTVTLSGDAGAQVHCTDAAYSFGVTKTADGIYSFLITQTDPHNSVSAPAPLIWVKKSTVTAPLITTPAASPYLSAEATLHISGTCESGATLTLSGGGAGSTTCINSAFSFSLPKAADGNYVIGLTQTDQAGNSASTTLQWNKLALSASPANPTLPVATAQTFTISGGTGVYTPTIVTNNSGGTLDVPSITYTTGPTANKTDTIKITDSIGETININVTTVAGSADHLAVVAGDAKTQTIGRVLGTNPKVQVVDQYGNGLAGIPLYFQMILGDAQITSAPIQTSDASGNAEVTVKMGFSALKNSMRVSALVTLPDLAGSGTPDLTLSETSVFTASAGFGLTYGTGGGPGATIAADFSAHGKKIDVAVLNTADKTVSIFISAGAGLYSTTKPLVHLYSPCLSPTGITTGDFDGDGKTDIAVACTGSNSISLHRGKGDGTFYAATRLDTIDAPSALVAADLNGDTKDDLAITSISTNKVGVHFSTGGGAFTAIVDPSTDTNIYDTGPAPNGITVAALAAAGHKDLVISNSGESSGESISVLLNNGSGVFSVQTPISIGDGTSPVQIAGGALSGGGFDDVAIANGDGTIVILTNPQDGTGILTPQSAIPAPGGALAGLLLADFGGDGTLDLGVIDAEYNALYIFTGTGAGTFSSTMATYPVSPGPVSIVATDANSDGMMDLLIASGTNKILEFFPGQGAAGLFGFATHVGTNPVAVATADFNGDGFLDLAVVNNAGTKSVSILQGSGNGLFTTITTLTGFTNPTAIAVGDFNGDGILDLAVTDSSTVKIFIGGGSSKNWDGTFTAGASVGPVSGASAILARDFNHDGVLDLAVTSSISGKLTIFIGHKTAGIADGTFTLAHTYDTGNTPMAMDAADVNSDGILDLVVLNNSDATVSVFIGNGDGSFIIPTTAYPTGGNGPISIIAADVNGDSLIDLITLNATDGTIIILQGDGTGIFSTPPTITAAYPVGNVDGLPTAMVMGDFNGDGKMDIAVTNGTDSAFSILYGKAGPDRFDNPVLYGPADATLNFTGLAVGDVNGDGKADLILTESILNQAQIWLGR